MYKYCLVAAALMMLAGCDQDSRSSKSGHAAIAQQQQQPPETIWVDVSAIAGGKTQSVEFDEIVDPEMKKEAGDQVVASSHPCRTVQRLWSIKFTLATSIKILKVTCSGMNEFQLTLTDGKGFVKPWTGTLLGT